MVCINSTCSTGVSAVQCSYPVAATTSAAISKMKLLADPAKQVLNAG